MQIIMHFTAASHDMWKNKYETLKWNKRKTLSEILKNKNVLCHLPGGSTFARLNTIWDSDAMHSNPILKRDMREGEKNIEIHYCITSCWADTEHSLITPDWTSSFRKKTKQKKRPEFNK